MRRKDICLISPPTRSNAQIIPIALIYLAGWLERTGMDVDVIDIKTSPYKVIGKKEESEIINRIVNRIISNSPYLVGLTSFTSEYNSVIHLAKAIKDRIDVKIVVGGVHASLRPEDFIYKNSPIDIAVIGEGEETLTELVHSIKDAFSLERVDGIGFLKDDTIFLTNSRKLIGDISSLPLPSYSKLGMDYYLRSTRYIIRYLYTSGVHVLTSRGCPFSCTFCAAKIYGDRPL